MAKEKLGNLLTFVEYDKLQGKPNPTKKTDVGGFAVLEHHAVGKEDQIDEIKKNLDKCSKKIIKKIYQLVEDSAYEKGKKELKEKESEKEEKAKEKEKEKSDEPKDKDEKAEKAEKKVEERIFFRKNNMKK
jgi:hypothetical protein